MFAVKHEGLKKKKRSRQRLRSAAVIDQEELRGEV